jgi:hypothetical protein
MYYSHKLLLIEMINVGQCLSFMLFDIMYSHLYGYTLK